MKRRDLIKKGALLPLPFASLGTAKADTAGNSDPAKKSGPQSFDYIIVGGGTAGPALAARLSENPEVSVLLIEAGKENTKEAMGFVNGAGAMWAPDTNWGYTSNPQKGLKSRKIMQPRGKVVGGCASINVGSWSRGVPGNYDGWGLEGWDWKTVLEWYRKIEDTQREPGEVRGVGGPMKLEDTPKGTELTNVLRLASLEAQVGMTKDHNGEINEGFDLWETIFRNGRRHNTVVNYLDHARNRSNLTVQTDTFVSRVIVKDGIATGVECIRDGATEAIAAKKEIILSAGAYATPKVLMLSGIGPADYLKELGITVVKDLPGVGQNLADHLRTDFGVMSPDGKGTKTSPNPKDLGQLEEWRRTGYGPLSVAQNTSTAFCKSSPDVPVADIELMFNINPHMTWGAPPPKNAGYYIDVGLVQPKSRGSIKLASKDPMDSLQVDPNYLGDERDILTYIKGLKIAMRFPQTPALKAFTDLSTVSLDLKASDDEIADYIRGRAESIYHPVGTAKMGNDQDPMAVVNTKLQVRGIKNLRVADASVVPDAISGHTMAPTILVAERAASFITEDV